MALSCKTRSAQASLLIVIILCFISFLTHSYFTRGQALRSLVTQMTNKPPALAYATLLTGGRRESDPQAWADLIDYLRLMTYQFLHAEETRTRRDIPFVILVNDSVTKSQMVEFENAGALIVEVELILAEADLSWLQANEPKWMEVLTKFRGWDALVAYERVLFLDVDTFITRPLDDIFDIPEAQLRPVGTIDERLKAPGLQYTLVATSPTPHRDHSPIVIPDALLRPDHIYAAFILLSPSLQLFDYYMYLAKSNGALFNNGGTPEEDVLSYAHRRDGPMPWFQLGAEWTLSYPRWPDVNYTAAFHKYFEYEHESIEIHRYFDVWRDRAEDFFTQLI